MLAKYWKLLNEYVAVRKELRRDLDARAARKADEYYFDSLSWKVFSAWMGNMKTLKAKFGAVKGQKAFNDKNCAFKLWRAALDKERLVWWEIDKHAQMKGRTANLTYYWIKFVGGVNVARKEHEEDKEVALKLQEVKAWLA